MTNLIEQVTQKSNLVLYYNINATSPSAYPGFAGEAKSLLAKIHASVDGAQ